MLVLQNLQLSKASSWEVNGNISFHSRGKTTPMLFSSVSWKLGEKPKAKKSKELKKIHILDCGFCCLSSRENMFMGKGPAWSQIFFQLYSSSWSAFKSICCYYFFINRNILYGLCDSCLQVKQPLVPCFLAISVSFRSYTQTVIGQFERPLQH